jgi:prophage regulatory protein
METHAVAKVSMVMPDMSMKPRPAISKLAEVKARTKLSASSIYRLVAAGKFPQPIKLSESSSAWVDAEIDAWLEEKIGDRAKPPAANPQSNQP